MSNTTEYYANKSNLTSLLTKIDDKLSNRYTKDEVNGMIEIASSSDIAAVIAAMNTPVNNNNNNNNS